jgi:hypothetical protein
MPRLFASALLTLLLAACGGDAARHEWLHGEWVLTYNPQRDSEDMLRFEPSGKVSVLLSSGKKDIQGRYHVSEQGVEMMLEVDERLVDAHFDVSPDRSRLIYHNGAYYTRR